MGNPTRALLSRGHQPVSGGAGPRRRGPNSSAGGGGRGFCHCLRVCASWRTGSGATAVDRDLEARERTGLLTDRPSGTSAFLTWAVPMRPDGSSGSLPEKAKKRRQICSPSSDLRSRTAARRTRALNKGPHRISDGDAVAQPQSHPAPATWATQRGNPLPAWQQPLAPRPEPWGRNDLLAPQRRTNLISVPRFWKTKPGDLTKAQKRSRVCASGAPGPQPGQERARASRGPRRGPRLGVGMERPLVARTPARLEGCAAGRRN